MTAAHQTGMPTAEFISLQAASAWTGIPYRTLRGWTITGALPAYKVNGRIVRVRTQDVEALFVPFLGD